MTADKISFESKDIYLVTKLPATIEPQNELALDFHYRPLLATNKPVKS